MSGIFPEAWLSFFVPLFALGIDKILGEPNRFHPLVGFGNIAKSIESLLNNPDRFSRSARKYCGAIAWIITVAPFPLLLYFALKELESYYLKFILEVFILYLAIGLNSLCAHSRAVANTLVSSDIQEARAAVSMMVSRNTEELNESDISRATVESVLENGNDAVVASLFWFVIGGAPLVILHRLANTLDAMWGYRNERFNSFGWFSAKADDVLAWPSAKLSSFLYLLLSKKKFLFKTIKNVSLQANEYKSLNGGWTIASGAFGLGLLLGGKSVYAGKESREATLGKGNLPQGRDIEKANSLVIRGSWSIAFVYPFIAIVFVSAGTLL